MAISTPPRPPCTGWCPSGSALHDPTRRRRAGARRLCELRARVYAVAGPGGLHRVRRERPPLAARRLVALLRGVLPARGGDDSGLRQVEFMGARPPKRPRFPNPHTAIPIAA